MKRIRTLMRILQRRKYWSWANHYSKIKFNK